MAWRIQLVLSVILIALSFVPMADWVLVCGVVVFFALSAITHLWLSAVERDGKQ